MKLQKTLWVSAVMGALAGASSGAFAEGTTAGTEIDNRASLTYSAGSTSQGTTVQSYADEGQTIEDTTFVVDLKVNFTVTNQQIQPLVVTNSNAANWVASEISITNLSNDTVEFQVSYADLANNDYTLDDGSTSITDSIDYGTALSETTVSIYLSDDATFSTADDTQIGSTTYSAMASLTDLDLGQFAADEEKYVFVVFTNQTGFVGADAAYAALDIEVNATNADLDDDGTFDDAIGSSNSGAANTTGIDIVIADENFNNSEKAIAALQLAFPNLSILKTAAVDSSGVFGGETTSGVDANLVGSQFAIPGSTVTYTLTITNAGEGEANTVTVTDALATTLDYVGNVTVDGAALAAPDTVSTNTDAGTGVTTLTVVLDSVDAASDRTDSTTYGVSTITFEATIK